jgi:SAM-dependent methyltransferase
VLTVFTPSHRVRYLGDCYRSLVGQTYDDWEWVVLLNGQASDWRPPAPDHRVRVVRHRRLAGVGAAKRAACDLAEGDILVELDHDDLLSNQCLERVATEMGAHPEAALAYSDFAQIGEDGSRNDDRFDESSGWNYDEVEVDGRSVLCCRALEPSPHNLGYIWFAPNHVRAFRRDAYQRCGGYDPALDVLDDQDLMVRLWSEGDFVRIPECLYLQRVHRDNTQANPRLNARIQQLTVEMYRRELDHLIGAWCRRRRLKQLLLRVPGAVELSPGRGVDAEGDAVDIDPSAPELPGVADNTVGAVRAIDVLQHVADRTALFEELHRVMVHGGLLLTLTPSTDGRGAWQDPSHVARWNENSFWYLTRASLRPALPGLAGRWQISHLRTYFPTAWHEQAFISYVQANLLAIKDGARQGGALLC